MLFHCAFTEHTHTHLAEFNEVEYESPTKEQYFFFLFLWPNHTRTKATHRGIDFRRMMQLLLSCKDSILIFKAQRNLLIPVLLMVMLKRNNISSRLKYLSRQISFPQHLSWCYAVEYLIIGKKILHDRHTRSFFTTCMCGSSVMAVS